MADRDHTTTHTTTTGTTGTTGTTTGARPGYGDPRTTTTTTKRRSGTSWIGAIIAILAIVLIAAWFVGGFEGEETAMMVGEPVVEEPVGTAGEAEAVIVAPVDEAAAPVAPATEEPVAPVAPVQQ